VSVPNRLFRRRFQAICIDISGRNRYLILDVLGQGTFGQVVKCQNLKTQEVVAVKVIKNKTAYFNQSMMEVSVLDLVGSEDSLLESILTFLLAA
jgi:serine/threonine protein kinase